MNLIYIYYIFGWTLHGYPASVFLWNILIGLMKGPEIPPAKRGRKGRGFRSAMNMGGPARGLRGVLQRGGSAGKNILSANSCRIQTSSPSNNESTAKLVAKAGWWYDDDDDLGRLDRNQIFHSLTLLISPSFLKFCPWKKEEEEEGGEKINFLESLSFWASSPLYYMIWWKCKR